MAIRKSSISGVPFGETADRPANPAIGQTFYNGTNGLLEINTAAGWIALAGAPPAVPENVAATDVGTSRAYNNASVSIAFDAGNGGGIPGEYIITPNPATSPTTFIATSSPTVITGLSSNTDYTYTMQARNNFGTSLTSAATSSTKATTIPQAPTIGTPTAGENSVSLAFTANATGGKSITNYKYSTDGTTYTAFSPAQTSSPLTISGLTAGQSYSFYLKAVNANGDSIASSASSSVTPYQNAQVSYLVVAGGAAGGSGLAGGGGAGGYRTNFGTSEVTFVGATSYVITVGGGGAGDLNVQNYGGAGAASSIVGGAISISSAGGGGGGYYASNPGQNGGSGGGGGGGGTQGQYVNGGSGNTPSVSPSQGNDGGKGYYGGNSKHLSGGGGGIGSVGSDADNSNGGAGGSGSSNSISGTATYYAAGGGGAGRGLNSAPGGSGGSSIGGRGAGSGGPATAGATNTGSGGGGGDWTDGVQSHVGAAGGSGIVILRSLLTATSTTGSPTVITDGSYKVYKFTSTGSITY